MPRKTVPVEFVRKAINDRLDKNASITEAFLIEKIQGGMTPGQATRLVLATLLEGILFETENYHGFSYRDEDFGNTDPTKRVYY